MQSNSSVSKPYRILRSPAVGAITGESKSTRYNRIAQGLLTTPISLGPRSVGWPEHEVQAIVAARIAGKTEDDIKALVVSLMSARKNAS
jgi:prophage regulatory protein